MMLPSVLFIRGLLFPHLQLLIGYQFLSLAFNKPVVLDAKIPATELLMGWSEECNIARKGINWSRKKKKKSAVTRKGLVSYVSDYPNSNPNGNPLF